MKTLREWKKQLSPKYREALEEMTWPNDDAVYTATEVLDMIVEYEGGVATGFDIRRLLHEVYQGDFRSL